MDALQFAASAGPYLAVGALAVVWKLHVSMVNAQCLDFRNRLTRLEDRLEQAHQAHAASEAGHAEFARQVASLSRSRECPLKTQTTPAV
jgi:hypothetical protein